MNKFANFLYYKKNLLKNYKVDKFMKNFLIILILKAKDI